MKVFVATEKTQGHRKSDLFNTHHSEMLVFVTHCGEPHEVDGECPCLRSMAGMITHQATTTFTVANVEMSSEQYCSSCVGAMQDSDARLSEASKKAGRKSALESLRLASAFDVGCVLEKRGNDIQERLIKQSPVTIP